MPQNTADPQTGRAAVTDEPAVLAAIGRSHEAWLSAEAIAGETGLPIERVRTILDTTAEDVIVAPAGRPGGPVRYSTREHYRETAGLLRRYFDALVSS
jgi:hypothetical protein